MELVEFLLARIGDDEAVARASEHADGPATLEWRRGGRRNLRFDNGASESYEAVFAGNWDRILVARDSVNGGPVSAHIARHDPARVLAECAAKRRIVETARDYSPELSDGDNGEWAFDATLRLLALPYRDHSDYDPAWNPEATQ